MAARTVYRELKAHMEGLNRNALACPPSEDNPNEKQVERSSDECTRLTAVE